MTTSTLFRGSACHLLFRVLIFSLFSRALTQVLVTPDGGYIGRIQPPSGLSTSCVSTFNRNITCTPPLLSIARGLLLPNVTDIEMSCDPNCRLSLLDLQAVQQAACSSNDTIRDSGTIYPATY
ncbi:hypothetical protein N656DRAFT_802506 [Canariomyces notabilis]|uniref:Uncharacterized protein n=1 Tax=Canariomyces notabilis TaxID=2074819 RepID=A0AAN6T8B6_9PEZI|nr:hypothetical protein N656DRAFT_802506 [Canariomyces arenarius]